MVSRYHDRNPFNALDYPSSLENDKYIIWYANEYAYPDPRRSLVYLSSKKTHPLNRSGLMASHSRDAEKFDTPEEAATWLLEQVQRRRFPYHGINITTGRVLKQFYFGVVND